LRVLYVDDDHNDLALFEAAAEKTDLDIWVYTVTSARQAVELLEGRGLYADRSLHPLPDVILLDLMMPSKTGFDFLEWRRRSPYSSVPVIVFCGSAYEANRQRAMTLGANLYLEKPTGFEELQRVVRTIWEFMANRRCEAKKGER